MLGFVEMSKYVGFLDVRAQLYVAYWNGRGNWFLVSFAFSILQDGTGAVAKRRRAPTRHLCTMQGPVLGKCGRSHGHCSDLRKCPQVAPMAHGTSPVQRLAYHLNHSNKECAILISGYSHNHGCRINMWPSRGCDQEWGQFPCSTSTLFSQSKGRTRRAFN